MASLPGVGPVTHARLSEHGLVSARDLLYLFPTSYEDYRRIYGVAELAAVDVGAFVVVRGKVARVHRFFRRLLDVFLEEDGARLRARWFRPNAGMAKVYEKGKPVALAGKLRRTDAGELELIHPSNVSGLIEQEGGVGVRPRYPRIEGVPARTLERIVGVAVERLAGAVEDCLPEVVRARQGLPDVASALSLLHRPAASLGDAEIATLASGTSAAHRRFAFEELFVLHVGLALERRHARVRTALVATVDRHRLFAELAGALPFALTNTQRRAVDAIVTSLSSGPPMQCLLQGDVGSGKTAVAFAASLCVARSAGQTLLMAPTAILAEQHFRTLSEWCGRVGLRCGLLHSSLDGLARRGVLEAAADGTLDIIVGTHALLADRLRLSRLALAIVDEQHRFGVRQRAALRRLGEGENSWKNAAQNGMVPHLLVLSATPIPRSLALTLYGDLDLITLDALPPGRRDVLSYVCANAAERRQAYAAVKDAVGAGGQGLVVCPTIGEGDDEAGRASVGSVARELRTTLSPSRLAVLHGQLSSDRQRSVIEAFRARAVDVLVSTTVVEVGVDLPGANVMVIEDAERFGLAQLHQLRGRVGRRAEQARCFFVTSSNDGAVLERLRMLAGTSDGFRIAEADLQRRGSGDLLGIRQSGAPELRLAHLSLYLELLESAREEARAVLSDDPALELSQHAALRRAVSERFSPERRFAEEAG